MAARRKGDLRAVKGMPLPVHLQHAAPISPGADRARRIQREFLAEHNVLMRVIQPPEGRKVVIVLRAAHVHPAVVVQFKIAEIPDPAGHG